MRFIFKFVTMAFSEQQHIYVCKKQIEEKFSFGNGKGYTQRDLEILSQRIEEITGVNISLSTLKRLWKNNYKQSPQLATLNALAAVLNFKDWHEFKLSNQRKRRSVSPLFIGIIIGVLFIVGLFSILSLKIGSNTVKINGSVTFTASKTIAKGIPNTVIFKYDLSNVEADSFFLQQSWNRLNKVSINPKGNVLSRIYYQSGYHRAKLMANDSILLKQPVHILSDGWEPHVYLNDKDFVSLTNENILEDGKLKLSKSLLEKQNINTNEYFETRITNSRLFNVSTDNFNFTTKIKLDSLFSNHCPSFRVFIVAEKHIFIVKLVKKGCERYANYKMGEVFRDGKDNDLSALGRNVYEWQEIGIKVKDKNAEISINGEVVFKETYKANYGDIKALIYVFDGVGSIDHVKLDDENGNTVFEDGFECGIMTPDLN